MFGCFFGEYSNLWANEGVSFTLLANRPKHLPRAKKPAIALLTPFSFKKKIKNNPASDYRKN